MIEAGTQAAPAPTRILGDQKSDRAGPTLVVIGGLHANEPAGIEAAERVHDALDATEAGPRRGRLISIRGNLRALQAEAPRPWLRARYIDEDLNRAFVDDEATASRVSAEQSERAELSHELTSIVSAATDGVFLLDLHTVSSESPAFIAVEDSLPARRFAASIPLPKILGLEEELSGLLMDYATNELRCVACIVEAGRHDDPRSVDVHEAVILHAMAVLGMREGRGRTSTGERPRDVIAQASAGRRRHFYDVRQRVAIGGLPFNMQPGAVAFMPVSAGRTVLANEAGLPIVAESSGLLFMPNRQREPRPGDDAFFVIARVGAAWLWLSARLRRWSLTHAMLPRLLPGVRRRDGDPYAVVVAPEYAAVLRRELLHLFGYRLVRWTAQPDLPWYRRLSRAAGGLLRAVGGMLAFVLRGGEGAALPREREVDWIARRRTLDTGEAPRPPDGGTRP